MPAFIDLTNQRFGRLTVVDAVPHREDSGRMRVLWRCACDCGGERPGVAAEHLKNGTTISCGCRKLETGSQATAYKHGHCLDRTASKAYTVWVNMLGRCYNPARPQFKDWGGRGIIVCDRWRTFENFLADMGEPPPGLTLDRWPDNDGNYEPGNCRWATMKEQRANQRKSHDLSRGGRGRDASF